MKNAEENPYLISHEDLSDNVLFFLRNAKDLYRSSGNETDKWERMALQVQAMNLRQKALALLEEANRLLRRDLVAQQAWLQEEWRMEQKGNDAGH